MAHIYDRRVYIQVKNSHMDDALKNIAQEYTKQMGTAHAGTAEHTSGLWAISLS